MPPAASPLLMPDPGTAIVRMYRIGHGDCFLIAYPDETGTAPTFILIDCGYKPGSPAFIATQPSSVINDIRLATGGHIHIAVITHEHQDHVNAISQQSFAGFTIDEAWFAWTEDPEDELANQLREQYHDTLLQLIEARNRLAAFGDPQLTALDEQLEFSLGGADPFHFAAASALLAASPEKSQNKQAMKVFKDLAAPRRGSKFLRPHCDAITIPGADNLRVFVLGPPRDGERLRNMDPQGEEQFHSFGLGVDSDSRFFTSAISATQKSPFAPRYCLSYQSSANGPVLPPTPEFQFFRDHYGPGPFLPKEGEVEDNAPWRRIDSDWLHSASDLALKMGDYINNTSLVLAFELTPGGKVLLFAADAQAGNWRSWTDADSQDAGRTVSTRDLLARTVLYKVGHHGSHNATLSGSDASPHPNLAWMAKGPHATEFTAMITAVRDWAQQPSVRWDHPLKAIKDALLYKASGRVFQTDTKLADMQQFPNSPQHQWDDFQSRTKASPLFFDYTVRF